MITPCKKFNREQLAAGTESSKWTAFPKNQTLNQNAAWKLRADSGASGSGLVSSAPSALIPQKPAMKKSKYLCFCILKCRKRDKV